MKNISPVYSHGGVTDTGLAQGLWENPDNDATSWATEHRSKSGRIRRGRRRYWGLLFKGKSLYVRGASGHVYHDGFLRTKHRSKILQLFYSL